MQASPIFGYQIAYGFEPSPGGEGGEGYQNLKMGIGMVAGVRWLGVFVSK
jgi:hypothetical protein